MEILNYFVRNPNAADTLEGIARWRLVDEIIHRKLEETRSALDWLVESGLLAVHSSTVTGPIFKLNAAKSSEAKALLATFENFKPMKKRSGASRKPYRKQQG